MTPLRTFLSRILFLAAWGVAGPCRADLFFASKGPLTLWGANFPGQNLDKIPDNLIDIVAIAGGDLHCLALKADGSVLAWGWNEYGQCTVPGSARNIVAIAAGGDHCLAIKADGTLVRWGFNGYNLTSMPKDVTGVTAISAGWNHCIAVQGRGQPFAWGGRTNGSGYHPQLDVPGNLIEVTALSAGTDHSVALRLHPQTGEPGYVVDWGHSFSLFNYNHGVHPDIVFPPVDIVAIAAGNKCTIALRANGTLVRGGSRGFDPAWDIPPGLNNVTAIAMNGVGALALKADGKIVWWGQDFPPYHYTNSAALINATDTSDITQIGGGGGACMLLRQPPLPGKANGVVNAPFSLAFPKRLALARYTASSLPPGLRINATTGIISGTPLSTGVWNSVVQFENITKSASCPVRFLIESAAYGAWGNAYWTATTDGTASNDDPDRDGLQNGVEYALGTNPLQPDPSPFTILERDATGHLSMVIDVPADRAPLVAWTAEFGTTLPFFSPAEAAPITEAGAPSGSIRYRFTDPRMTTPATRFGRLKVTLL